MKVETPQISWHNRDRIAGIDFQPKPYPNDKIRLASGGDDKHVVIWHLLNDASEATKVECLCDLSRHQNTVNAVRWSGDGKILASADSDFTIILWTYQESSSAPDIFGESSEVTNVENWTNLRILRGHLGDVIGLSWSPCSSFLVSCSTDDTAVVFDVNKSNSNSVKVLNDGKGWLNGIAWDPKDKYIASICSDRSLRIYQTKNFKCVQKLSKCKLPLPSLETGEREEKTVKLFHDDSFQSFYRRLAFSPDGELLVVPSGVLEVEGREEVRHCTYVFTRADNFSKPVLYLPSKDKEFSTVVRFCPVFFDLRPTQDGEADSNQKPWEKHRSLFSLPYRMVFAVGTQKSVQIYDTQQAEPIARVYNIHYISLNDLTWSSDGRTLVVSSTDGFCSFITFKEGELGDVYQPTTVQADTKSEEASQTQDKENESESQAQDFKLVLEDTEMESQDKPIPETNPVNTIAVKRRVPLITVSNDTK